MRIDELDEFQGITPQLVTGWLLANGWTETKPRWWERGEDAFIFDSETFEWFWTHALAAIYTNGNVQALLREINPRMRPWPSRQARSAHDGLWMVVVSDDETGAIGRFRNDVPWFSFNEDANGDGNILSEEDSFALYWPCDAKGNKVRWPEKDGVML